MNPTVENFTSSLYGSNVPEGHPPVVTIGLPVRNAGRYLEDCLRSIFAQTLTRWELVIVDDGSEDDSVAILEKLRDTRVRTFCAKYRRGLAASLNQISKQANGKYIARMDADDAMHPERLRRQVEFLDAHQELDGAGCGLVVLDRSLRAIGKRALPQEHEAICAHPLRGFLMAHASFVGRAEWFRAHPYNEGNQGCEDWELWASSYRSSHFANLPDLLYFYRELDSFALPKYLRKKAIFAARLWNQGRREFGVADAAIESGKQFAHMAFYCGAAALGQTEHLLRLRNVPLTEEERVSTRAALERVKATVLPQGGRAAEPGG